MTATKNDKGSLRKLPRSLLVLSVPVPILAAVLIVALFLIFQRSTSGDWAVHVDGQGNVAFGSWWWLFLGTFILTSIAFLLGQYLARDFSHLGHWYPMQKAIVILCFSTGYGFLGYLTANMSVALLAPGSSGAEQLVGYGLLGFLLTAILAGSVYTALLPKAQDTSALHAF
ncbi:MAG: hypothetical protein L0K41_08420 [Yaniella sp.]|uniref:hypothetical protein n=2 Tax=Yaniella sp. TaxID=2773929 RepID=UPI002649D9AA|nr:hypothetical protein [Yaniella sp.]MDN5731649.1 hypothetical protein [Yaniella sp.]MDN5817412.1 hypothetical protein [Yaniella sp.]MDN5838611.1 hypothetical protein [Yaniella sp.]MDN5889071.1 hypothetical protein [Yaniella sp.]MDN5912429.1 hypothetical protein [Yaniella sp.]